MAMTLIQTVTVGSGGAASIEFTGIPQDRKDLVVLYSMRRSSGGARLQFNDDTGNIYDVLYFFGSGSSVITNSFTTGYIGLNDGSNSTSTTANTFASGLVYIANYTSSADKTISSEVVTENNATQAYANLAANRYNSSSAITKVKWTLSANEFSSISLYSIS